MYFTVDKITRKIEIVERKLRFVETDIDLPTKHTNYNARKELEQCEELLSEALAEIEKFMPFIDRIEELRNDIAAKRSKLRGS